MSKQCQTEFALQRKALLENSLLDLLHSKRYSDITVSDICQAANIPRRTFYHYFESKDDVLDSIVENTMQQCFLSVMFELQFGMDQIKQSFIRVFQFWQGDNRKKLDILIQNGMESRLMAYSQQWVRTEKIGFLQNSNLDPKLVEIGLMVGVTDFFSLLFYWCRNGYQEAPEQMAEYAIWVLPQAFYNLQAFQVDL